MIRTLLPGLFLALLVAGCTDDPPASTDMGTDTNNTTDTGNDVSVNNTADIGQDLEPDSTTDMPAEDMPAEDMPAEDMPAEDMPAEDMPAEDMPAEDMPISGDSVCSNAIDVTAGGVWANETTVGGGDNYEARVNGANCPNGRFSGEDRAYVVQPTVQTSYTVRVEPAATFDPMIYVRTDCDAAACVTGTVLNGTGVQESVTFTAMPNTRTHIIVDGELGSSGTYQLTVTVN